MHLPDAEGQGIGTGTILRRKENGHHECVADEVAIEEPLEIRIGGSAVATTMRTPGNDEELVAGFLFAEGAIRNRSNIADIGPCVLPGSMGNVMNVALAPTVDFRPEAMQRFGTIASSCGLCGKTSIEFIRQQFPPIDGTIGTRISEAALLKLPDVMREAQGNFSRTGGIHGAGIFDLSGNPLIIREDVGRHNAVDKAIGRAFLDDLLPLRMHVLVVSGRSSLEIVQKALAAGIPIVAAVSAPSSLAVNFARECGQTLIGFLRPPTFNIYSHIERIALQ
jgi:FdhD protein